MAIHPPPHTGTSTFHDRRDAGRRLAERLKPAFGGRDDLLVFGLPRGGVPVAAEVAAALDAPLDAFLVRKLGVPGFEELAFGAIASGGVRIINQEVVQEWGLREDAIEAVTARERQELSRRERLYRGTRRLPDVVGKIVILVDVGLATGSTMRAAAEALRQRDPARIVAAVPVAPLAGCETFASVVDETVCVLTPEPFVAVGYWYDDFSPTSDEEVRRLLAAAEERRPHGFDRISQADPDAEAVDAVRRLAVPWHGDDDDYRRIIDLIGDARFVLIGEASHGTEEFYRTRAELTKRLIAEHGFAAVAAEADWPDAYRVNCYVRGEERDADADAALGGFRRFPQWMWRNTVVLDFVSWLRRHNDSLARDEPGAGFYGLDLYSLGASIEEVISYLDRTDPEAAARARARYGCFEHLGDDPQAYGYAAALGVTEPCEDEVVAQLLELQRRTGDPSRTEGPIADDARFAAEQNARLAKNAEAYYRAMFRGRASSWNLRDRHMAETLDRLADHLSRRNGRPARIVVWAHNSHLGDARATEMGEGGEINLGQLVREGHGGESFLLGFSTHRGTVTAANDWGEPAERKRVRPGLPHSFEDIFHRAGEASAADFLLPHLDQAASGGLATPRLQRAIGVIYRPETERFSHYVHARLPVQFDAMLHLDETRALEPLERTAPWEAGELPETFPSGQ